jgi:hypothetical protein
MSFKRTFNLYEERHQQFLFFVIYLRDQTMKIKIRNTVTQLSFTVYICKTKGHLVYYIVVNNIWLLIF